MNHYERRTDLALADLPEAIAHTAEDWGAEWQVDEVASARPVGGRLVLPVVFGLRRGVMAGRVEFEPAGDGTLLSWRLEESHLAIQRSAVVLLGLTVVAILPALAWPFVPRLFALMPFAAVMALLAWWLVLSRLETSGPEEFFAAISSPPPTGDAPPTAPSRDR